MDLPGVLGLVDAVAERWGSLDILVNNAAQTVRRSADYHREVRAGERAELTGPARAILRTGGRGSAGGQPRV
ncbi:NAD(P)-dependent dehydrogenase (short-subunit alcohol dehydrogenase family) [Catenuloplanes nepalensis]|uniref:NAD(P)-dependent dehydrogenase (Short-subunit alcohol dehydrogenase family) n=1 Tax=Catenuloplanes nepalensis TaxID=587533 RepID=A0ABT9MN31_9ACTN|nr:hypothetical protein [Catenuloplanes nepalensis]MDP9792812.1 NAD(P)-dependent dehydrogenase (short-subunit alcohol dehydrogenase family) [Catenuloplanes nepalensis]